MKFYEVRLKCFHLQEMKEFYTEVLGMELVGESDSHFAVMAGTTRLIFEKSGELPFYHICFRTGSEFFDVMYDRLLQNGILLPDEEGGLSMFWQGKQAYFLDPDGNIQELLERPFHHGEDRGGWHDIGELGLPSGNVAGTKALLSGYIRDEIEQEGETFSFCGDKQGVFVAVQAGRHWYPTDRAATIHPITAIVSGEKEGSFTHPDLPYRVVVKREWEGSLPAVQFRAARPTNQLDSIIKFYREGVGLKLIGGFKNHEGYDGAMLGLPDYSYHLEFTQHEHPIDLPVPTKEHLLVFYLPNRFEWERICSRLGSMGYEETAPDNPYWSRGGRTFLDPDGWCVVLMNTAGIY